MNAIKEHITYITGGLFLNMLAHECNIAIVIINENDILDEDNITRLTDKYSYCHFIKIGKISESENIVLTQVVNILNNEFDNLYIEDYTNSIKTEDVEILPFSAIFPHIAKIS